MTFIDAIKVFHNTKYLFCFRPSYYNCFNYNNQNSCNNRYHHSGIKHFGKFYSKFRSCIFCHTRTNHNPFFSRPKPLINISSYTGDISGFKEIPTLGTNIILSSDDTRELWVNVRNEGKTPIKRMRVRVKIVNIDSLKNIQSIRDKPDNIDEITWNSILHHQQEFNTNLNQYFIENNFGKPLPFSKTPRGTIALPWVQLDGTTSYEVDLPPKSDDASIRLVGVFNVDMMGRNQLKKKGVLSDSEEDITTSMIAYLIGNVQSTIFKPIDDGGFAYNLAVKFWITAENLSEEVSEIFHIEIPKSFGNILCNKYKRNSKEYKEIVKLFSI